MTQLSSCGNYPHHWNNIGSRELDSWIWNSVRKTWAIWAKLSTKSLKRWPQYRTSRFSRSFSQLTFLSEVSRLKSYRPGKLLRLDLFPDYVAGRYRLTPLSGVSWLKRLAQLVTESILKIKDDIQDSSSSSFHTCSNHNNSRQLPSNGGTPCSNSNRSVSRSNGGSSGESGLGGRQRGKYRMLTKNVPLKKCFEI